MDGVRPPLDEVDEALAKALADTPRATIRALANTVGLSHSATRARVNNLIDAHVVEVVTLVHPATHGQTTRFYATITYRGGAPPDPSEVPLFDGASLLWRFHDTPQLQAVMGAHSVDAVQGFLNQARALDWVESVSVAIVLQIHRAVGHAGRSGPPVPRWDTPQVTSLDTTDQAIVRYLRARGRATYTDVAQAIGLSLTAARRRIQALEAGDAIRFVTFVNLPGTVHALLYFDIADRRDDLIAAVTAIDGMVTVTEMVGAHDVACTLAAPHEEALAAIVDEVSALSGVTGVELHRFTTVRRTLARAAVTSA